MGLFIRQEERRTELQERIAAELREKAQSAAQIELKKPESTILANQHETRLAGKTIIVLVVLLVLAIILLALRVGGLI